MGLCVSLEQRCRPADPSSPISLIDRRRFLGAGAAALGVLALPGCVTTVRDRRRAALCLPPVQVSPDRIIRATAGLRPYRAGGFVVRRDQVGGKHVVHNYGHGGAGITLSWGSSRLACDLGLPGHGGPVAVLGAGVMGLTTARLVQEAGLAVTIYAADLPPDTTSSVSGGQWLPTGHFEEEAVSPEWHGQYLAAATYSYRRFRQMESGGYGVRAVRNYLQTRRAEEGPRSAVEALLPGHSLLGPGEHPFPAEFVRAFDGMMIAVPAMLDRLTRDFTSGGGQMVRRRIHSPAELEALPERLVFNCTGLGSRELFGDAQLQPVRGQLVWLEPQPGIDYSWSGSGGYMFPREDAIILGGTFEYDEWSTQPQPETTAAILAGHQNIFDSFRC